MCLRTSEVHGCQVHGTSGQPYDLIFAASFFAHRTAWLLHNLIVSLAVVCLRTSEVHGCRVHGTSEQPYGLYLQSLPLHIELRGCYTTVPFLLQLCAFAHLKCMVVQCMAPLNNLMVYIRSQCLCTSNCVVVTQPYRFTCSCVTSHI